MLFMVRLVATQNLYCITVQSRSLLLVTSMDENSAAGFAVILYVQEVTEPIKRV